MRLTWHLMQVGRGGVAGTLSRLMALALVVLVSAQVS